jgi:hypothetical protein
MSSLQNRTGNVVKMPVVYANKAKGFRSCGWQPFFCPVESFRCDEELFDIRRFALNRLNQLEGLAHLLIGPPENEPDRTFCTTDATSAALEGRRSS